MRSADQWLAEYGQSHRNVANERLHWICVPVIVWCVVGFLWIIPVPGGMPVNWAQIAIVLAIGYYFLLSARLALGAGVMLTFMAGSVAVLEHHASVPLWWIFAGAFIVAWVGQFIGHAIEGKRPSFFKDLQFLMIGPIWLLASLYRRLGIALPAQR